jgi:hypothetical protein
MLEMLAGRTDDAGSMSVVMGVVQMAETEKDRGQARKQLLILLAEETTSEGAAVLLHGGLSKTQFKEIESNRRVEGIEERAQRSPVVSE